jgi:hypothetical protein
MGPLTSTTECRSWLQVVAIQLRQQTPHLPDRFPRFGIASLGFRQVLLDAFVRVLVHAEHDRVKKVVVRALAW